MSDREIYLRLRRRAFAFSALCIAIVVAAVVVSARTAQADELSPDPGCGRLPDAPWCAGPSDDPLEHVTASAVQSCEDGLIDVVYTVALDAVARGPVGVTVRTPLGDTSRTVAPGETVTVTDDTRTSRWWGQIVVAGEVLVDADWGPLTCDSDPVPPAGGTDDEPGPVTDDADDERAVVASGDGAGAGPVEVRWPDPAPDAPDAAAPPVDTTSDADAPAADGPVVGDPGDAGTSPAADATPDTGEIAVTAARATGPDAPGRPSSAWWALILAGAAVLAVAGIDSRWRALSARVAGTLRTTPPTSPGGAERGPVVSPTRSRLAAGDGRTPHTSDRGGRGEL